MILCITGTPGTGKSTLAKQLAKRLKYKKINLTLFIKKEKLRQRYDPILKTYEVDAKKVVKKLLPKLKENIIIDGHLSHELPAKVVDLCIVCTCNPKILSKRLKKRRYTKEKIQENIDAEIFEVCLHEAEEKGHTILIVDTTKKVNFKEIEKTLKEIRGKNI